MYVSDEKNAASLQVQPRRGWALWWQQIAAFPWRNTVNTLRTRFGEDRLGLTASSLTFTTMLALVPFFTVALALLTAFPMFATVEAQLQRWLIESLIPSTIASQVLGYITQFASKASRLGLAGLSFLLVTALALILTMDRTLNNIWRVRQLRPLGQRVLIYWAAITLGPLLLGASLAFTSYVMSASGGLVKRLPDGVQLLFDSLQFVLLAGGMASLYHYVPNTPVKWRHAWTGGVFVAVCIELAKKVLALYLGKVPTYSVVYGAFATLPILLVWIYVAWVIVLLGAVVTAYLPKCGVPVIQNYFPEAMALGDRHENRITAIEYKLKPDAIGIGIGMGQHVETEQALHDFLKQNRVPLVIDADGLNILAKHTDWLSLLPPGTILTPHPKELSRMIGEWSDDYEKIRKTREFARKYKVIVIIKGAFSLVIDAETIHVNSSGTPALATAGSGDVLAGMITSLLAQGSPPLDAARVGVYLHGLTGDLTRDRIHERVFIASDIIDAIGTAYRHLEGPI